VLAVKMGVTGSFVAHAQPWTCTHYTAYHMLQQQSALLQPSLLKVCNLELCIVVYLDLHNSSTNLAQQPVWTCP
jgi:hypothetical protein